MARERVWSGEASWFCCGSSWGPCTATGTGACQTCQSAALQCAWPNTSKNCFDITRPDLCGERIDPYECGHVFFVSHWCTGTGVEVTISDCGPRTKSFCDEASCCDGKCRTNRVIDLTPAAFSKLAPLDSGLIPVAIDNTEADK